MESSQDAEQSLTSAGEEPNTTVDTATTVSVSSSSSSSSSSGSGNNASCSSSQSSASDANQSLRNSGSPNASSSESSSCSNGDNRPEADRCEDQPPTVAIVITDPPESTPASGSGSDSDPDLDADDATTAFEDAHSNRWVSSQEASTASGGQKDATMCEDFATPAAASFLADEDTSAAPRADDCAREDDNDDTPMPPQASVLIPTSMIEEATGPPIREELREQQLQSELARRHLQDQHPDENQQPSLSQQPVENAGRDEHQEHQQHQQQLHLRHRSAPPRGIYGGPGTAFPPTLLRRRLAAFPVVLPSNDANVDAVGVDPADSETASMLADRLAEWEAADGEGRCGVCQRGADRPSSGGFLGYPVCACAHLHPRCALVGILMSAPDAARCLGCGCQHLVNRVGRVKPLLDATGCGNGGVGPLSEAWFTVAMATGLSTCAALLAVSAALLLTLGEPLTRSLMAGANLPLLGCLFGLLAVALLVCFVIGWLLDRYTGAVWERVYSSRLQIAYKPERLRDSCDRVLAASLMACSFLDYRPVGYPFPKRGSCFVNYYCLRQPATPGVRA